MIVDVVVLGSGPAGLQAAMYVARRKKSVVVVGKLENSSLYKHNIENYCCVKGEFIGKELLKGSKKKAQKFGAKFIEQDAVKIEYLNKIFNVTLENNEVLQAKSVVVAIGIKKNNLGLKEEGKYIGKGISYCVDCDGPFFKDKKVIVIGNSSAAVCGALVMEQYAKETILIYKELNVDNKLKEKLNNSSVKQYNTWIKEIKGDEQKVIGCVTEKDEIINIDGIFVEMGSKGVVELFSNLGLELDQKYFKYIKTDKEQKTNIKGLFAAGDVCGAPFQLAKAVGEGCIAGFLACKYLDLLH